jgi:hypothetical protein
MLRNFVVDTSRFRQLSYDRGLRHLLYFSHLEPPYILILIRKKIVHSPALNRKVRKKQNDAEMFDLFFCQSDHTGQSKDL